MTLTQLKNIINEVIEEGKGDISNKMRQRTSQSKFKERHKYTKPELQSMNTDDRQAIAKDLNVSILIDNYDSTADIIDKEIDSILEAQDELI